MTDHFSTTAQQHISQNPFENNYAYNEDATGAPDSEMHPNPFAEHVPQGVDTQPNVILFPSQQCVKNANETLEIPLSNQPPVTPSGTTAHEAHVRDDVPVQGASADVGISGRVFQSVQYYFDVDTDKVLSRMLSLVKPTQPPDFLENQRWHMRSPNVAPDVPPDTVAHKKPHADIYGPFWTMTTLWVVLGIVVNLLSRINYKGTEKPWGYDFGVVVVGASVAAGFWIALPVLWWVCGKFNGKNFDFPDLLCLNGYALLYFLIVIVFCAIPFRVAHYVFCILGSVCASAYLVVNLWKAFWVESSFTWGASMIGVTVAFQIGFAAVLKFYFFNL